MGAITFEYGDPKQTGVDAPTRGTLRAKLGTREVVDGVMRTTAPFDIVLVEGGNIAELSDTGPDQYWEVRELAPIAGRRVWYKKVAGDSAFAELEDVNPTTFEPLDPLPPSAQEILAEAGEARTVAVEAAATAGTASGAAAGAAVSAAASAAEVTAAVFPDETAITYDGAGNVQTVTENGITTTYTYDAAGNVATDSRLVSGVTVTRTYTYDPSGNLIGIEAN